MVVKCWEPRLSYTAVERKMVISMENVVKSSVLKIQIHAYHVTQQSLWAFIYTKENLCLHKNNFTWCWAALFVIAKLDTTQYPSVGG